MSAPDSTLRPAAAATARAASTADCAPLARMLARAFLDDPFIAYLVTDAPARPRKLPLLFSLLFKLGLPFGACDATAGMESAAIWRPPDRWHVPFWQYVTNGPTLLRVFGTGALRVMRAMDTLEAVHPHAPHWYLQSIGTDPDKQ